MSLTRAEWEVMWRCIKTIERCTSLVRHMKPTIAQQITIEVTIIKSLIQKVIGQME
jgi:hypothetical protein